MFFKLDKCLSLNVRDQIKISDMRFAAEQLSVALRSKPVPAEAGAELNFNLIPDIERFHLPAECSKNIKIGNSKHDQYDE